MDPITIAIGLCLLVVIGFLQWQLKPRLVKVYQGSALVRHRKEWLPAGGTTVNFSSTYVIKLFDKFEIIDLTTRSFRSDITGRTQDDREFTLRGELLLRLPAEEDNILVALEKLGSETLGQPTLMKERFETVLRDTTSSVAATMEAEKWPGRIDEFHDRVLEKLEFWRTGFQRDVAFIDLQIK